MNKYKHIYWLIIGLLCIGGCVQKDRPSRPASLSEANQKIIELCKKDNNLDIILTPLKNTVWIYLPLEESFFELQAKPNGPQQSKDPKDGWAVHYVDSQFNNGSIEIDYDIAPSRTYSKDFGYSNAFTEKFRASQRGILSAISRAYSDVEELPDSKILVAKVDGDIEFQGFEKNQAHKRLVHSHVNTEKVPEFFIIVMSDIVQGVEARITLTLKDLRRAMTDHSFMEEYTRRVISEYPTGNTDIIGDTTGEHLDIKELTWPEFLSQQIVYRINFKYTRSAFPPEDQPKEEILKIIREALKSYEFTDYQSIVLKDLRTGETHKSNK